VANVPEIILADEPTGNLDGETTARVMDLFYRLNRKGSTLLIATHDTRLYRHDKDRVIELRFGRLQSAAQTRVIKAEDQPETTEIQEGL
jgi:cell division transport system ATP-binding protein